MKTFEVFATCQFEIAYKIEARDEKSALRKVIREIRLDDAVELEFRVTNRGKQFATGEVIELN